MATPPYSCQYYQGKSWRPYSTHLNYREAVDRMISTFATLMNKPEAERALPELWRIVNGSDIETLRVRFEWYPVLPEHAGKPFIIQNWDEHTRHWSYDSTHEIYDEARAVIRDAVHLTALMSEGYIHVGIFQDSYCVQEVTLHRDITGKAFQGRYKLN